MVLDQPEKEDNWVESSCTCLFIYSYAKAIRKGILEKEYDAVFKKAYQGIEDRLYYDEKGFLVIDNICTGTCIESGTYDHYIKRAKLKNNLHGVGAFILMCVELELYRRENDQN